jgi:hypothetical protein
MPIDAEARGKVRVFKAGLTTRYAALQRALKADRTRDAVYDFAHKGELGRRRALDRLNRIFGAAGAQRERLHLTKRPVAIWSCLRPRGSVVIEDTPGDPGIRQDCVTCDFLVVGETRLPTWLSTGLWTLEVTDHALGRLFQDRQADAEAAIREAHMVCLAGVDPGRHTAEPFLLHGGRGYFLAEISLDHDVGTEESTFHVRCRTWLHQADLFDDQDRQIVMPGVTWEWSPFWYPWPLMELEVDQQKVSARVWRHPEIAAAA